jgi:hypothetical protein
MTTRMLETGGANLAGSGAPLQDESRQQARKVIRKLINARSGFRVGDFMRDFSVEERS